MGAMVTKVGLHGVQGLAPARGKRRNACSGKTEQMDGQTKTLADNQRFLFDGNNDVALGSLKRLFECGDNGVLLVFA